MDQSHLAGQRVRLMVGRWMRAALENIKTKVMNYVGGPGNRTQVPVFAKRVIHHPAIQARL